jgi:hypothetical protein
MIAQELLPSFLNSGAGFRLAMVARALESRSLT